MVIYRVNVLVDKEKEEDWKNWMSSQHIRDVINTGHFTSFSFSKLINASKADFDTEKFSAYEIRYVCKNLDELKAYENNGAQKLRDQHTKIFGEFTSANREVFEDLTEVEFLQV